ncbi:MAG: hypothetical protein A3I71_01820 [Omnitrophica WOR_2 bacterium RIFCSPLOWO2_02_FULL_63_16]|nr:MAG: hypothetical protein A2Z92_05085 [Omnitrophica WOR_2 bacterium GWA2_63_20]OGX16824.1 MAG: hypothetical protein A2105_02465 [Omnitrophica WOR_2 bacterium GWF2_63_9]OGX32092.1 MAG: hypothetical protein A3E56_03375 [Omnitrophica WOR_2 bacterium RIFCSPHIGHO2_12_FULL_64_13]OGX35141.1 MAG: hypothetical protein A3B73_02195 [Omnitrophica WOR_2 bacterium RIFCSPHIGHO2_02_FULL_63_39]OGX45575.1 MAG: hypothetical protein A3I71_01820 [Omnitrophica WOR_2 bacterium RIFCSPLOWO2_02_FULL_63_16]OGX48457.1
MTQLLVIQHVPHERLGSFEGCLTEAGCRLLTVAMAEAAPPTLNGIDGLIVMGGPQSVYDQDRHPWMAIELALLREALRKGLPILGVCLGAQMLAAALGARVTKNPQKEIGWYPVMREPGADGDPLFEAFGSTETVFQWHGDTCALPKDAIRLASSPLCMEQAFRYRDNVYGLQFHVEVTEPMIRAWMRTPVNRAELDSLHGVIDPMAIRRQTQHHVGRLQQLSRHVAETFCRLLTTLTDAPHG